MEPNPASPGTESVARARPVEHLFASAPQTWMCGSAGGPDVLVRGVLVGGTDVRSVAGDEVVAVAHVAPRSIEAN